MSPKFLIQALLALLLVIAGTSAASAHAGLVRAEPAEGSVLSAPPAAMELTFTEPVSPIAFSLVGVGSAPAVLAPKAVDGPDVMVELPAGLRPGSYLFSWRVTSEDGHPVNGTIGFAVGAPSGTIAAPATDPAIGAAIWLVRAAQYAALFLGVGGIAFGAVAPLPAAARRIARTLALAGLVLVPAALGLQGLDLLGARPSALWTAAPWAEAIAGPYAQTEALLALAYAIALLPGRTAAILAALLGALAPTLSGHASTAEPQGLMRLAVFVHMASLIFWLGALPPLLFSLRANDRTALLRFSRAIPLVVATLLASGLTLAVVQLGPAPADWFSAYGDLLAAKLLMVVILLLIALWNRVRLTARAKAGDAAPLRRSIGAELVLVVAILGVVAGWRFTPPPRVLAEIEAASAPIAVALTAENTSGTMHVAPGRPGPVSLAITLSKSAEAVTVALANPGRNIATIEKSATLAADGRWQVSDLLLPAGGDWSVAVAARTGRFDLVTLRGSLHLKPVGKETQLPTPKLAAAVLASSMLAASPAFAAGVLESCPTGQSFAAGDITVSGAFTRATPPSAQSAGGYFSIHNAGDAPDTLTGASSEAARDVAIHSMKMNGQVMEMAPVEGGLDIPPGGTVTLDPRNYHLMMTGLATGFREGQCVAVTLHFARAGDLPVELNVGGFAQQEAPGAGAAPSGGMDMDMSGMSSMPGM